MNEVVLVALGIVATCVGALIWLLKFIMTEIKVSLDKNSESHQRVATATALNTKATQETVNYLKNLNGRLADITAEKIEKRKLNSGKVKNS